MTSAKAWVWRITPGIVAVGSTALWFALHALPRVVPTRTVVALCVMVPVLSLTFYSLGRRAQGLRREISLCGLISILLYSAVPEVMVRFFGPADLIYLFKQGVLIAGVSGMCAICLRVRLRGILTDPRRNADEPEV